MMRVEQVQEQEKRRFANHRATRILGQPFERAIHHDVGGPHPFGSVVMIVAFGEPVVLAEDRSHERCRLIAGGVQHFGEHLAHVALRCEVGDRMNRGVKRGEETHVGGDRPRSRRKGLLEDNTLLGESGQIGRGGAVVAVNTKVVGSHRVQRDENDVGKPWPIRAAGGEEKSESLGECFADPSNRYFYLMRGRRILRVVEQVSEEEPSEDRKQRPP